MRNNLKSHKFVSLFNHGKHKKNKLRSSSNEKGAMEINNNPFPVKIVGERVVARAIYTSLGTVPVRQAYPFL